MTTAARKVQERIFGRAQTENEQPVSASPASTQDPTTPSLTIDIPKPQTTPTPGPLRKNPNSVESPGKRTITHPNQGLGLPIDGLPINHEDEAAHSPPPVRPYRERLAQELGEVYKGTEKYRLEQDDNHEKHWKRWGPYLSDRQWASSSFII